MGSLVQPPQLHTVLYSHLSYTQSCTATSATTQATKMKFKACVLLAVAASAAPSPTLLYSGLGYDHGLHGLGYGYGGLGYSYGLSAVAAPLLTVAGIVPTLGATPVAKQGVLSKG